MDSEAGRWSVAWVAMMVVLVGFLAALKWATWIDWPWWGVTSPLWTSVAVFAVVMVLCSPLKESGDDLEDLFFD